jgi:hypothetical protein
MFSNFIYLIIAILIFTIYQPTEAPGLSPAKAFALATGFVVGFAVLSRWFFRRLAQTIDQIDTFSADHRYTSLLTRLSIMAVALFAVLVHGLGLPSQFGHWQFFQLLPTLLAIVFLLLFLLLLSVVWYHAYACYRPLYGTDLSRQAYIVSNWRMSVPVLIPWVMISLIADILLALPFESPKRFLATTEGEVVYFLAFLVLVAVFAPHWSSSVSGDATPLEPGFHRARIEEPLPACRYRVPQHHVLAHLRRADAYSGRHGHRPPIPLYSGDRFPPALIVTG